MQKYFNQLFRGTDSFILIWHNKKSYYYTVDEFDKVKEKYEGKNDVYIGVNTRKESYNKNKRGGKKDIDQVYSLWMDLDIKSGDHQKDNLFTDLSSFFDTIEKNKLHKPTMTVQTGGGYHLYWLLKEPYNIESEEDRLKIEAMCKEWQDTFAILGDKEIDATWNVDRVLRLPDTINNKYGNKVELINQNDRRFTLNDFELIIGNCEDTVEQIKSPESASGGKYEFEIDKNANPPFDKFNALKENSDKFRETWNQKRKDMKDSSQSGYDLSLATFLVKSNWDNQEIVNALVKNRLKHGNNVQKISRKDYYYRTIKKARQTIEKENANDQLDTYSVMSKEERKKERGKIKDHLSNAIGIDIERIVKYIRSESGESSEYVLYIEDNKILLPDVSYLIRQRKFDQIIADMVGKRIKHFKSKTWRKISQYLLDICLEVDMGVLGTAYGMVLYTLDDYLDTYYPEKKSKLGKDEFYSLIADSKPTIVDDMLYIHFYDFFQFYSRMSRSNKKSKKVTNILKQLGLENGQLRYKTSNEDWKTKRYWKTNKNELQGKIDNAI